MLALLLPASAAAQTPITGIGLGYPVHPIDGRAAALGATGLGIMGSSFSLLNPADLTQHEMPGFALSFHAEGAELKGGADPVNTGRQRFNLVRAVAPFGDWSAGIGFGGAFDQDWSVRFRDTLILEDGTVPFEETREHDGGISTIDLSLAREFGPIAIGFSAQRNVGSLRQSFSRAFDPPTGDAPSLGAAGGGQLISFKGWRFRPGAAIEVADRYMLSGVLSFGSQLTATPNEGEDIGSVDLPLGIQIGGSVRAVEGIMIAGSFGWEGWSSVGDILDSTSHDVTSFGGGIEYDRMRLLGGEFPLRFGARRTQLPFSYSDRALVEKAITGGFGWIFQNGLAEANVAMDFGSRGQFDVDGVEESFRRLTVSFALRQIPRF